MDFVNKVSTQAAELLRSLSSAARLAAGLLVAVVVVSLVYLVQSQVTRGDEFLLDGRQFSAGELTSIEAAFAQAGLGGSTVAGNRIRIPHGQKAAYVAALAEANALPADFYKYFDDAVAAENPFVSSRSLELKHANAKMKELALIISRMQGIESATVQFDEEARPGLARTKQKTAMVAVWMAGGSLGDDQVRAIRNVVASAYAGLPRRSITITDMTSRLTFGGAGGPDDFAEGESTYASYKLQFERDWQRKIADQLSTIPGVKVNVNVDLWPEARHTGTSATSDPHPVSPNSNPSKSQIATRPSSHGSEPAAAPSSVGNQPIAVTRGSAAREAASSESQSEPTMVAGREQIVSTGPPLAPKHVTAAIDVPASYYVKVWRERNQTLSRQSLQSASSAAIAQIETEVRARIRETVRHLVPPVGEGADPYAHITVSTYTDLPAQAAASQAAAVLAQAWLTENWRTLALVLLGCSCLFLVRSMVRSTAAKPTAAPTTALASARCDGRMLAGASAAAAKVAEQPPADPAMRKRFQSSGADLKSELQNLVKENPDAAASVLRMWIGDAV
jgi:flagellar M-ring protein FliF